MLDYWEAEARTDNIKEEIIQAVVQRLRAYEGLSPAGRAEALKGLWKRITDTYPEAGQRPATTQPVAPPQPSAQATPEPQSAGPRRRPPRRRPPRSLPRSPPPRRLLRRPDPDKIRRLKGRVRLPPPGPIPSRAPGTARLRLPSTRRSQCCRASAPSMRPRWKPSAFTPWAICSTTILGATTITASSSPSRASGMANRLPSSGPSSPCTPAPSRAARAACWKPSSAMAPAVCASSGSISPGWPIASAKARRSRSPARSSSTSAAW